MSTLAPQAPQQIEESCFLHILRDKRKLWRPVELAEALGLSLTYIYELINSGDLEMIDFSARKRGFRPDKAEEPTDLFAAKPARRNVMRITRRSVLKFIYESANYDLEAQELAEYLVRLMPTLPTAVLKVTRERISQILATRNL